MKGALPYEDCLIECAPKYIEIYNKGKKLKEKQTNKHYSADKVDMINQQQGQEGPLPQQ